VSFGFWTLSILTDSSNVCSVEKSPCFFFMFFFMLQFTFLLFFFFLYEDHYEWDIFFRMTFAKGEARESKYMLLVVRRLVIGRIRNQ